MRFRVDAGHIALAPVGQVDIVVSWNFMHIVRFDKIRDEQYEALKDRKPEEHREFYRREAEALHRKLGVGEPSRSS